MCDGKHNVGGRIEIVVEDSRGNIVKRIDKPMDSFVENMLRTMLIYSNHILRVVDRNNSIIECNFAGAGVDMLYDADIYAASGDDNYGIIVGSGSAAFDVRDYWLSSQISHGSGSGQLMYGDTSLDSSGFDYITWTRAFDNQSGADVQVSEVGVAAKVTRDESGTPVDYYVLLARDVITTTTVPNGGRLTVKYTFGINC